MVALHAGWKSFARWEISIARNMGHGIVLCGTKSEYEWKEWMDHII